MSSAGSPAEKLPLIAAVVPLVPAWRLDRSFDYLVPQTLASDVSAGMLVRVPLGHRRVRGVVVEVARRAPERELEEVAGIVLGVPLCPPPLTALAEWTAVRYAVPRGRAYARFVPPRVRVRAGEIRRSGAGPAAELVPRYEGGGELLGALGRGEAGVWCFRCTSDADQGALVSELAAAARGQTLVCVPEVRFGSKVLEAVSSRLPHLVRVDSEVSDGDRARAWMALASGHVLGGGGRAAVFAPAPGLSLIVVSDEHHPSYKEDRAPRYDARRVAIERSRLQGAMCVLMSPTPSVETGAAAQGGGFGSVVPARSDQRAARPIVEVVDPPTDSAVSRTLHARIRAALDRRERVALLAPRRGYARALWCAECRRSLRCPVCESGLSFDLAPRRVRCGRCGFSAAAPDVCPTCGASNWRRVGAGSERLADQLQKMFPRASVARADPETLQAGELPPTDRDVYVTTWIGTKPTIRPEVSLVGVLDADALIRRSDFRAAESAYEALVEMAAWAGAGGRLVVQSAESMHHAIQAVVRADYSYFLRHELADRTELGYPPAAELVRVTADGPRARVALEAAAAASRGAGGHVLGPIPLRAPRAGLEILVKCPDAFEVASALRGILAAGPGGATLRVDVDPR